MNDKLQAMLADRRWGRFGMAAGIAALLAGCSIPHSLNPTFSPSEPGATTPAPLPKMYVEVEFTFDIDGKTISAKRYHYIYRYPTSILVFQKDPYIYFDPNKTSVSINTISYDGEHIFQVYAGFGTKDWENLSRGRNVEISESTAIGIIKYNKEKKLVQE